MIYRTSTEACPCLEGSRALQEPAKGNPKSALLMITWGKGQVKARTNQARVRSMFLLLFAAITKPLSSAPLLER